MKKQITSILALAVGGLAVSAHAAVVESGLPEPSAILSPFTYTGTTAGGPTFDRPNASGTSAPTTVSTTATAVPYDVVMFTVATSGSYTFLSTAISPVGWDNYTALYTGIFNAASPLTGALIANDNDPTAGLSGFTYSLTAGTQYSFVTTGATNASSGSFTDTITTAAVPEPGTWVMIGASAVGLAGIQRFRRRSA